MATTAQRIKEALELRNMKQIDLIEKTKISKGALSSYISGNYEPKQKNLYKLAMALNVSESWLMGLDVPMDRNSNPSSNDSFISYINSLGYRIFKDDPEHKPFLSTKDATVVLPYDSLSNLKLRIDSYTKATLDSEILSLKEEEIKEERLKKERLIRQLRGENIYEGSQYDKDRKAYLEAKAAHERTDTKVTDEMRKHDDDIMNEEDF